MSAYNDLEIQCFIDAIDRYRLVGGDETEEKSARLQEVLKEGAHVLELLLEERAAGYLRDIADELDFDPFSIQKEFNEYKRSVEEFLDDELSCSTLKSAKEAAGETSWVEIPAGMNSFDAEELLHTFEELGIDIHTAKDLLGRAP